MAPSLPAKAIQDADVHEYNTYDGLEPSPSGGKFFRWLVTVNQIAASRSR